MNLIDHLNWRYATKKFDTTKKVSVENLEKIKEAIQLSASSFGLQLYKALIIENKELREKLKPASWDQNQIIEASHLFVFCNITDVKNEHIDEYLELKAKTEQLNIADLKGYGDFLKEKIFQKSKIERSIWTANQTYLALGNLLNACAELKIDACPMEGFESEKYNEILGLTEQGLSAAVIATVGYRSDKDDSQSLPKTRKPIDKLFEIRNKSAIQIKDKSKNKMLKSFLQAITLGFLSAIAVLTSSFFQIPTWVLFIAWVSYYAFGTKPKSALLVFTQQILGILIAIMIQYGGNHLAEYFGVFGFPIIVFILISPVFYLSKAKYLNNIPAYFLGIIIWFGSNSEPNFMTLLLLGGTLVIGFVFAWINETITQRIHVKL